MTATATEVVPIQAPIEATSDSGNAVARAASGDRRAFEHVYRTHLNHVFSLCVRMTGDRIRAEELTQDVFVRAWEKLPTFRGESAFSTWLHRLTVNVVLNERRVDVRERGRTVSSDDDEEESAPPASSTAQPMHAEKMDIERAIAKLPKGARKVFVLHDVEGFTHEEIGSMLGVTAGGCKAQLHRARLLLREALTR
jgi:RNA polymerase sigma-70 factor (ECF subfamily)